MRFFSIILLGLLFCNSNVVSANKGYWHGKERKLRYTPEGDSFVIVNGDKKFNRALYGTNTAFRIETGDVPELGFFMPHMGGNMQFGVIIGNRSLWLNDAQYIKSIYRPGSRIYEITDPLFEEGTLTLTILALADDEGMVAEFLSEGLPLGSSLVTMYGGASNRRFFRNGDLGVDDPKAFELHPDNCLGNVYDIKPNSFTLTYGQGSRDGDIKVHGVFPPGAEVKVASAYKTMTPQMVFNSKDTNSRPVVVAQTSLAVSGKTYQVLIKEKNLSYNENDLARLFSEAEAKRQAIAGAVEINTPDPYFNTLGGTLAIAADGIWEDDCWLHGAVGWRMPLNGWRAAYVGDAIGWHDRARRHFNGYAASQITHIEPVIPHPAQDTTLNMARALKKWGTQMYSNGYICRNQYDTTKMHHYDMNLVYIDALLWHIKWTGDRDYARQIWPVIERHLAWEKRNFDPDDDGLYDAYASIWASDALQYNSGGVTHSSAYNYRANKIAAEIAQSIGVDPSPYKKEAAKILNAINSRLWMDDKGWWAEFQDFMGHKKLHPDAALWTVYHAIDSDIHTPFQAWQATSYINNYIPHIPVLAKGLEGDSYYTVATTNWLPYSWSINNVAFAEVAHTSLAYWQAGRADEAFHLFKSSILDGMYLGSSPGNIGQVSFYDAARGECYRDFGDPVGVYSRVLIQGLFGVIPDALNGNLLLKPGFPADWDHASLKTSDISLEFKRTGMKDRYMVTQNFAKTLDIRLQVKGMYDKIGSVSVNGRPVKWRMEAGVGRPEIIIPCGNAKDCEVVIDWLGEELRGVAFQSTAVKGDIWSVEANTVIKNIYDPQGVLSKPKTTRNTISGRIEGENGHRTLFVRLSQGSMEWWQPVEVEIKEPFAIVYEPESSELDLKIGMYASGLFVGKVVVNRTFEQPISLEQGRSIAVAVPRSSSRFGTNLIELYDNNGKVYSTQLVNWNIPNNEPRYDAFDISSSMNANVTDIFRNEYLTPRSPYTTLQVPTQGIGEWCHPLLTADIDDSGFRESVKDGLFNPFEDGIPFRSYQGHNIVYTSLWDNYPTRVDIPVSGKASHAYLLMAGSTNHMQCHMVNGIVSIEYQDGTSDELNLINSETWVPIEQDFYIDNEAFRSSIPRPYRVSLKTGLISRNLGDEMGVKPNEVYQRQIDGGAGVILDIPLDPSKELKTMSLEAKANEVVIGLMAVTLMR